MYNKRRIVGITAAAAIAITIGCNPGLVFNPAFVNQTTGSVFPLTPKDDTGFVLVRANNSTTVSIEFHITIERIVVDEDDPETILIETETVKLLAPALATANDLGVLVDCPVFRVGLGVLDRPTTEPGLFVGAVSVGQGGFGVPPNVNPLNSDAGNFDCGDTIIFQAFAAAGVAGGVAVSSFVLDDDTQPDSTSGLDTFRNARSLINQQPREE